jgi:hypothetical protein
MGRYSQPYLAKSKNGTILRFRENFELLARKGSKWLESHSPKVGKQRE